MTVTEYEKNEIRDLEGRIFTIGNVRRYSDLQVTTETRFYNSKVGEQLGYRYEIIEIIDKGSFGQVVKCIDHSHPKQQVVALKISKRDKTDISNAAAEIAFLKRLKKYSSVPGGNRIVEYIDSFMFRQHMIIVFEFLHVNLFRFVRGNPDREKYGAEHLRRACY